MQPCCKLLAVDIESDQERSAEGGRLATGMSRSAFPCAPTPLPGSAWPVRARPAWNAWSSLPIARSIVRRRQASTTARNCGSFAHRNAVRRGTPWVHAHVVTLMPCATARASWVFVLLRRSSPMALFGTFWHGIRKNSRLLQRTPGFPTRGGKAEKRSGTKRAWDRCRNGPGGCFAQRCLNLF